MSNAPYTAGSLSHLFFELYISLYACGFAKCSLYGPPKKVLKQNAETSERATAPNVPNWAANELCHLRFGSMSRHSSIQSRRCRGRRRVAETRAHRTERGDRPGCQRGRFPERILGKITSISTPPPSSGRGNVPEDGSRHYRRQNRPSRSSRRRRRQEGCAWERPRHPGSGRNEAQSRGASGRGCGEDRVLRWWVEDHHHGAALSIGPGKGEPLNNSIN